MISKIGYPDSILKPKEVADKFKDLPINKETYFENAISAEKWFSADNLKDILKPVDRKKWHSEFSFFGFVWLELRLLIVPALLVTPPTVNAVSSRKLHHDGERTTDRFTSSDQYYNPPMNEIVFPAGELVFEINSRGFQYVSVHRYIRCRYPPTALLRRSRSAVLVSNWVRPIDRY